MYDMYYMFVWKCICCDLGMRSLQNTKFTTCWLYFRFSTPTLSGRSSRRGAPCLPVTPPPLSRPSCSHSPSPSLSSPLSLSWAELTLELAQAPLPETWCFLKGEYMFSLIFSSKPYYFLDGRWSSLRPESLTMWITSARRHSGSTQPSPGHR